MWTSFINTCNGFTKLAAKHYKNWSGPILRTAVIFFAFGSLCGMLVTFAGLYLYYPDAGDVIRMHWLDYSFYTGTLVMLAGCGTMSAAFSRNPEPPVSLAQLIRETPRNAWSVFLLATLVICIVVTGTLLALAAPAFSDNPTSELSLFSRLGSNLLSLAGILLTGFFAGAVFIKAAGGRAVSPYRRNVSVLLVVIFILIAFVNAAFSYTASIVITPLSGTLLARTPEAGLITFISILAALLKGMFALLLTGIWVWMICGAFYEEENEQ